VAEPILRPPERTACRVRLRHLQPRLPIQQPGYCDWGADVRWDVAMAAVPHSDLPGGIALMLVGGVTTCDTILILTQGGPGTSTTATSYYMYEKAFQSFQFGNASVIAVVLATVCTIISLILVRLSGWDKMRSTQEGV